jgi:flagellar biosynthesis/type III secretory pathway chaperone
VLLREGKGFTIKSEARYSQPFESIGGEYAKRGRADEIAEGLAEILEREAALYRDASDISIKKTDIIVHGKIEELDALVKIEQAIIVQIGKLEDEREQVVRALSDELELDLNGATLSKIGTRLGRNSYDKLDRCHKSLASTLAGLKNSNDTNARLIQNALDYVNFSVNLLTTNQSAGTIYSQDGADDAASRRRNVFDVKL